MALVSSYDAFIFDYGGVLVRNQTEADQEAMAQVVGVPEKLFNEFYWLERADYDKDLLSSSDYWQRVAQMAGKTLAAQAIEQLIELDVASWMHYDALMWQWIADLRAAGKRVAMLSNMPRELGDALKTRTGKLRSFDHVTLSYEIRSVKPEPAAYEHCLEGLGSPSPEQTLFLDDRSANVEAAKALGIQGFQFTTHDAIRAALQF